MEERINKLIMLVGPSYSGKSTWAKKYVSTRSADSVVYLSSDEIRGEIYGDENDQSNPARVFDLLHRRAKEGLKAGKTVIYDATNLSCKRRTNFLRELNREKIDCVKYCVVFAPTVETLIARMASRERKVPFEVVQRQLRNFQTPVYGEGWDSIVLDKQLWINDDDYISMPRLENLYADMTHDNPHHQLSVCAHMRRAADNYINSLENTEDYDTVLYWAIRYHDIGKFYTKAFRDKKGNPTKVAHFYGHQNVGAYLALTAFTSFMPKQVLEASALICYHMEHYVRDEESYTKFKEFIGPEMARKLEILHRADAEAH